MSLWVPLASVQCAGLEQAAEVTVSLEGTQTQHQGAGCGKSPLLTIVLERQTVSNPFHLPHPECPVRTGAWEDGEWGDVWWEVQDASLLPPLPLPFPPSLLDLFDRPPLPGRLLISCLQDARCSLVCRALSRSFGGYRKLTHPQGVRTCSRFHDGARA